MTRIRASLLAFLFAAAPLIAGVTEATSQTPIPSHLISRQVVDVGTGTNAVRYLMLSAITPRPSRAVMLFAGGNGLLQIQSNGTYGNANLAQNFLVRSAELFVQQGLLVAVIDAPGGVGSTEATRVSAAYSAAMSAVIGDLRSRTGMQKVWLIGTSSGTLSAASIAGAFPLLTSFPPSRENASRPDGVVLTATQTKTYDPSQHPIPITPTTCTATVFEKPAKLHLINVPAYVVAHRDDGCPCSPSGDTSIVVSKLVKSPVRASAIFPLDGSQSPAGPGTNPCSANTRHGFYSIEASVVANIANWIKTH